MASEWINVKLADVTFLSSGKRPPSPSVASSDDIVPIFGGSGITGYTNQALHAIPVIITGRVGTLGLAHKTTTPCWPSDNALVLRPKDEITFDYLYYSLTTKLDELLTLNRGTSQPLLTQGDLGKVQINLPSLPEQRAIAGVLCALDDKIELLGAQNRTLEAMARALFRSWFVRFDPVQERAAGAGVLPLSSDVAALFPAAFEDSALGPIPQGWRVSTIGEVSKITNSPYAAA